MTGLKKSNQSPESRESTESAESNETGDQKSQSHETVEKDDNQESEQKESSKKEDSNDLDLKLKLLEDRLLNTLNTSLNGLSAKLKKDKDADSGVNKSPDRKDPHLEALQNELTQLRESIAKKEENERIAEENRKKEALIRMKLSAYPYDDFTEIEQIFTLKYPPDSFSEKDGIVYYQDKNTSPKTLDTLVKEFHNKIGKRFLKPSELVNGTGKDQTETKAGKSQIKLTDETKKNPVLLKQYLQQNSK